MTRTPATPPSEPNRAGRRAAARRKAGAALSATALATTGAAVAVAAGTPAGAAPMTFTVSAIDDSGLGTLRQAIEDANANLGADTIEFEAGLTGTITLLDDLPTITEDLTISGPGAGVITVDGTDQFSILDFRDAGTATVSGLTLTNGVNPDNGDTSGGAIALLGTSGIVSGVVVTSSYSENDGGGIWCAAEGSDSPTSLTITGSVISGNQSYDGGGGLYTWGCETTVVSTTISGNTSGYWGGGVVTGGYDTGLTLRNSTVSGNSTQNNGGGVALVAWAEITNSTISGNTAGNTGGAIASYYGSVSLTQSTVTDNVANGVPARPGSAGAAVAPAAAGGIFLGAVNEQSLSEKDASVPRRARPAAPPETSAVLLGTILTGDTTTEIAGYGSATARSSVIGPVAAPFSVTDEGGNQLDVEDAGLGPLQDNGGPTRTHALLEGSPAIDAGPDPLPSYPLNGNDQRGDGYDRVSNGRVDVGAFEVPAPVVIEPNFTG